jgi:hypothetical protein
VRKPKSRPICNHPPGLPERTSRSRRPKGQTIVRRPQHLQDLLQFGQHLLEWTNSISMWRSSHCRHSETPRWENATRTVARIEGRCPKSLRRSSGCLIGRLLSGAAVECSDALVLLSSGNDAFEQRIARSTQLRPKWPTMGDMKRWPVIRVTQYFSSHIPLTSNHDILQRF